MLEVFGHPEHVGMWRDAVDGTPPDWDALYEGYAAAVDWPTAAFWRELSEAYPNALVLLSTRPAADWWRSADRTVFEVFRISQPRDFAEWHAMTEALMRKRFVEDFLDPDTAMAAFEDHNAAVRAAVPAGRLLEWTPGDGWAPICAALGVPVPDEPFPHVNRDSEFRARAGWD
jgi:hypothetical protein